VPDVEAPEGSGCWCSVGWGWDVFGLVPDVEGVGDECGVLVAGDLLELELGGETGVSGGAGGSTRGVVLAGMGAVVVEGPKG